MTRERELGFDRKITRRDFINGVAVSIAAAKTLGAQSGSAIYPPALTGLRGSHVGSFETAHRLRDGAFEGLGPIETSADEEYDLVVVGGGLSGLSAAYFFRKVYGADKRVLILDNHDDFGGHAKRNEFRHDRRTFIGYGGTMGISTPFPYSYVARSLVEDLGVDVFSYPDYLDSDLFSGLGLSRGMFFDRETYGRDALVCDMPGGGSEPAAWKAFFDQSPLSEAARRDLIRLYDPGANKDTMPGLAASQKKVRLAKMSYQDYLTAKVGLSKEALPFLRYLSYRNNKYIDTCPALEAFESGSPGFAALGLEDEPRLKWDRYRFHFPDGNATLARLLVSKLVPGAIPGEPTMHSIVQAPVSYERLDEPGAKVRIRLNSTVVRVEHEGLVNDADWVRVGYASGGKTLGVRARNVVLACYNAVIPYLAPEVSDRQKRALSESAKVPLLYTNVFIRNWKAFEKLGVSRVSSPHMYHGSTSLDRPVSIGGYQCSQSPDEPIILHLSRCPSIPGLLPRRAQLRAGMHEMVTTPFETMELSIREQLGRILGAGGFDPADDILGITVNRWPHGYAYTPDSLSDPDVPEEERPHVVGRKPFGRVAIANSDAGAAAFTNTAIDEAHRAVLELARTREPY